MHRGVGGTGWVTLVAALGLWSCAGEVGAGDAGAAQTAAAALRVVDDAGNAVDPAAAPRRIVSLIPAVTEFVVALGAADRLIARTDYDTNPLLDTLPSVGGGLTPDLEWLVQRRPDLVIGWTDGTARTVLGRLRDLGVSVYAADIQSLADADSTVLRIGRLLDLREAAEGIVRDTRSGLDEVRRAVDGMPRPSVLYVLSTDPPMTAGPGTFLHEVIELAGGINVFADAGARWPTISLEQVVARDPDVLLVPVGEEGFAHADQLARLPGWASLSAVRAGRVHEVDAELFHRPGPHLVDVARTLARTYYPGVGLDGDDGAPGSRGTPTEVEG
ncbi:MAG: cobalamin-binding protein [Gemmatimonadota bacterium]